LLNRFNIVHIAYLLYLFVGCSCTQLQRTTRFQTSSIVTERLTLDKYRRRFPLTPRLELNAKVNWTMRGTEKPVYFGISLLIKCSLTCHPNRSSRVQKTARSWQDPCWQAIISLPCLAMKSPTNAEYSPSMPLHRHQLP